jgi:hypothetical protein
MSTIFYAFDHSRNLYYIFSTFDHKLQEILVLLNHRVFQMGVEKRDQDHLDLCRTPIHEQFDTGDITAVIRCEE